MSVIREINPLLIVGLAFIAVLYLVLSAQSKLDDTTRDILLVFAVILILLAFLFKEKKLLTIREAQEIAYRDSKKSQNKGEIREEGKLVVLEDGRLRRISDNKGNETPNSIYVAVGLEGPHNIVLVYGIHPYTGYILSISKREYWDSTVDPDLKIVIPPQWVEFLEATKGKQGKVDIL